MTTAFDDKHNYPGRAHGFAKKVVQPGEFAFACAYLDHNHIEGMAQGLTEAGADLRLVYDPDPAKVAAFCTKYPQAKPVDSFDRILDDKHIAMVASARIANRRGDVGIAAMQAGKDFFSDKPLFTEMATLDKAKQTVAQTGRKYMGYFGERIHVECAVKAGEFVQQGRIGRVVQVMGMGPHRANIDSRPPWFFNREEYGGILCDIGSHQIEQFLYYTGATDATISASRVANYRFKQYPGLEDFGDVSLVGDNGATGYFRLDWLTPDALETWGDGRVFILGTDGYIELRKYTDVGGSKRSDTLFLVNKTDNERHDLRGKVGYPFFGEMILDCLYRTENAMTQQHIFKTSELAIQAQQQAVVVE